MPKKPKRPPKRKAAHDAKPFRLLDLPAELVIRVLGFSVVTSSIDEPIEVCKGDDSAAQPSITRTCRLLRDEGLKLFYSGNVFWGFSTEDDANLLWTWLQQIGKQNRTGIESLFVSWSIGDHDYEVVDVNDPEFRAWEDFCLEIDFLADHSRRASNLPVYIRQQSNKIYLEHATSYQLSLKDQSDDGDHWIPLKDLGGTELGMSNSYKYHDPGDEDWWVLAENSGNSSDGQDG